MTIREKRLDGIHAHRLKIVDGYFFFTHLQGFLSGAMTTNFCRRRIHPQQFEWQVETGTGVELDLEYLGLLMHNNACRGGDIGGFHAAWGLWNA